MWWSISHGGGAGTVMGLHSGMSHCCGVPAKNWRTQVKIKLTNKANSIELSRN